MTEAKAKPAKPPEVPKKCTGCESDQIRFRHVKRGAGASMRVLAVKAWCLACDLVLVDWEAPKPEPEQLPEPEIIRGDFDGG